jgi:long-chain acyl-CoA synthetase
MAAPLAAELPKTLAGLPAFVAARYRRPDLLGRCRPDGVAWIDAAVLSRQVLHRHLALVDLGLGSGDRVVVMSESRPEWVVTDLAALSAGGVTAPIYPTLTAEQAAYIVRDCGAGIAVVSTAAQLEKMLGAAPLAPSLRTIIVMDPAPGALVEPHDIRVVTLSQLDSRGEQAATEDAVRRYQERVDAVRPDSLATLIYTSGTTGEPKGVMLTHANLIGNLVDICEILPVSHEDTALSFLPLSHAFERMVAWVYLAYGIATAFAESNETIGRDLLVVRPTVMTGVPRVFEKLRARILEKGSTLSGVKARLFQWGMRVARSRGELVPERRPMPFGLTLQAAVAERLVFRKVRAGLGGRFRFVVSGSAALNVDVARFFFGLGLPIIEGYGLTETSPVLTVTPNDAVRLGAVGVALPRVRLRIADDGEILCAGPNIMQGYFGRPAETAEVLRDGWFHTGDIGTLDTDGYLRITDRKKELIVTSGGKKIAPQPIEQQLKAYPLISEAVIVGEHKHYPAVLLVPDFAQLAARTGQPVPERQDEVERWLRDEPVIRLYAAIVEDVNAGLAQYERLKQFRLLPREFSQAGGELTPTFKVKRRVIESMYAAQIASIYGSEPASN